MIAPRKGECLLSFFIFAFRLEAPVFWLRYTLAQTPNPDKPEPKSVSRKDAKNAKKIV
jgi:hypothetical protein